MEIRNDPHLRSDITRPIRDGIKERVDPLPRESDGTDKVSDRARDLSPSDKPRAGAEPNQEPEVEAAGPTSIQKRGRNARLKIKHELFEKRIHSARKRVTERAKGRGQRYRKSLQENDKTTHTNGPDKAVLSDKALSLSDESERSDKLADIKRAYREHDLNTQELIARTAFKMLDRA